MQMQPDGALGTADVSAQPPTDDLGRAHGHPPANTAGGAADEQRRGLCGATGRVRLGLGARSGDDDDAAFATALADHGEAAALPVRPVEGQDLGDSAAGGHKDGDESAIAQAGRVQLDPAGG